MAKILLVNIGMHGHVNPTLGMARELVAQGHELHFLATDEFAESIERTGASFVSYPSVVGRRTAETARQQVLAAARGEAPPAGASAMERYCEEFVATLPALKQEISAHAPDLVIYDLVAAAAKVVADHLGIPAVQFFTTYASNEHYNLLRESFAKHDFPTGDRLEALRAPITRVLEAQGLGGVDVLSLSGVTPAANLVFMPRVFQPRGDTFDQRFRFCGPCFAPQEKEAAEPLLPPGDGPLMVVCLGSLCHEWPEFFRDCITAFKDTPWRVVMGTGNRLEPRDLGPVPVNFTVAAEIPQIPLLAHADLFIGHGGMNSTMESLAHGVPLVVVPQIEEQAITAARVAEMQLGVYLKRQEVDAAALAHACAEVHQSSVIKANAIAFQREIAASGGAAAAAAYAVSFARTATDRGVRSPSASPAPVWS